jgi:3-carboxy-cis,cis-muconate cycloisomerase
MMALAPKMGRSIAHDKLSKICIAVSEGKGRLIDLLSNDPDINKIFDRKAIERLLDPANYLGNSQVMVDNVVANKLRRE